MSTKNLVYLSIQQTLQDLIYFITEMNVKHGFSEDTKWIAIGGAKGGSLAAWLRYLYSNVVHGAVASSAPMHFQPEIAGRSHCSLHKISDLLFILVNKFNTIKIYRIL